MTRWPVATAALALAALALTACAAPAPAPADPGSAGQTPVPAPDDSATPSDIPEPDAEPTCETILSPYVVAELRALNWTPREDPFMLGGTPLPDGIQCVWGDQTMASDHVQIYGWAPVDEATVAEAQAALEAEGWVRLEEEGVVYLTENPDFVVMADSEGYGMTYEFGDGWVAVSDTKQGLEVIQWPAG